MRILTLALTALLFLSACGTDSTRPTENWSERKLYNTARKQLEDNNFLQAVSTLQMLESRYPFGPYAEQAQLELIYAHFRSYENEATIASAERFIRLHPQHPHVDYAYYMKGLANYSEGRGLFDNFLPMNMSMRDPGLARESFNDFQQLIARYPDSPYAADAKARMVYQRNLLARYEINVANYYFKRGAYLAAANRGRFVVENYPKTPASADALAVIVQAYLLLDMDEMANDTLAVLKTNYPEHPSIGENGEFITKFTADSIERSWINKLSFGLLDHAEPPRFETLPQWGY
jgi:outer membrane protein assembly factor BamD